MLHVLNLPLLQRDLDRNTVLEAFPVGRRLWRNRRTLVRFRTDEGEYLKVRLPDIRHSRLQAGADGFDLVLGGKKNERVFKGREAQRVAGLIVPRLNAAGAGRAAVQAAVRELDTAGGPDAYLARLTTDIPLGLRSLKAGEPPGRPPRQAVRSRPPCPGNGAARGTGAACAGG